MPRNLSTTESPARRASRLRLSFGPPCDGAALLAALRAHAVPGMELADPAGARHARLIAGPRGPAVVTIGFAATHVDARVEAAAPADLPAIKARLRRWLDLDADPAAIRSALEPHPRLAPLVARRPGLRILGSLDGFETAALTVIGQQVSLAAGRTFAGRLVAAFGTDGPGGLRAFPRPEVIAAASPPELQQVVGLTRARSRTLHALAEACARGLVLDEGGDHAEVRRRLLALPGIGPWTLEYLAVRALGDRDAYPADDLVLKRALGVATRRQALALAEPWRPWRAYALFHLWTHAAYG